MEIVILDSAYKHGVTEESICSCIYDVRGTEVLNYPPLKKIYAGFDTKGNALEIIALEDDNEKRLTVFHAMKIRKQFYYLLGGN